MLKRPLPMQDSVSLLYAPVVLCVVHIHRRRRPTLRWYKRNANEIFCPFNIIIAFFHSLFCSFVFCFVPRYNNDDWRRGETKTKHKYERRKFDRSSNWCTFATWRLHQFYLFHRNVSLRPVSAALGTIDFRDKTYVEAICRSLHSQFSLVEPRFVLTNCFSFHIFRRQNIAHEQRITFCEHKTKKEPDVESVQCSLLPSRIKKINTFLYSQLHWRLFKQRHQSEQTLFARGKCCVLFIWMKTYWK